MDFVLFSAFGDGDLSRTGESCRMIAPKKTLLASQVEWLM